MQSDIETCSTQISFKSSPAGGTEDINIQSTETAEITETVARNNYNSQKTHLGFSTVRADNISYDIIIQTNITYKTVIARIVPVTKNTYILLYSVSVKLLK